LDSLQNIVLVVVYNYPFYSSIPTLKRLYGRAFAQIVFCGPKGKVELPEVEYIYHHKGYYGYICLARAIELYPPYNNITEISRYQGYLLINDDVMLNFWNFAQLNKNKIWEGPKVPIQYAGRGPSKEWYWWRSRWGMTNCQKAFNNLWSLKGTFNTWSEMNVTKSIELLARNGYGQRSCYRGRSDIFYIPRQFAEMFDLLAYIFYKHSVFLEIAVPTMLRMLDVQENFEFIPGVYIPGRVNDTLVQNSTFFRMFYNRSEFFVHPMKLNYKDAKMNRGFLEKHVFGYIDKLCQSVEPNTKK